MCRAFSFHRIILRIITSVPICSVFTAQNIQTSWKYSCRQQHFYFPQKLTGLCFPENQTWSLIWGHSSPAEPSPEQVEQSEAVRGHGQAYQNLQKRSKNKKRTDHVKGPVHRICVIWTKWRRRNLQRWQLCGSCLLWCVVVCTDSAQHFVWPQSGPGTVIYAPPWRRKPVGLMIHALHA